jgi:hypothetical protein
MYTYVYICIDRNPIPIESNGEKTLDRLNIYKCIYIYVYIYIHI